MKKLFLTLSIALLSTAALANHEDPKATFAKHDTNSDGFISKAEFTAKSDEKFRKIDTNSDGKITLEEKQAFWSKKKAEHNE